MARFPIDTPQRKIASRANAILHYSLNSDHWIYREETEADIGRDCTIELSIEDKWSNNKIECQVKGTEQIKKPLKSESKFSFPLSTKTIMYALNSPQAFVLFYIDVKEENVYYLPIQDYFIADTRLFDRLNDDHETLNVHIPTDNILTENDLDLQEIAKSRYSGGPGIELRKEITNIVHYKKQSGGIP